MKPYSTRRPYAAILEQTQDFATLEEEWEDLYRNSPIATPFQSWAWLYSWWEFYGEGYELRLITVRSEDLLVGIIPLMLERRGGFERLLFIGTGLTDYLDSLVREGWENEVSEAGEQALRQMPSWHVADFQQLRPEAAAWSVFKNWAGPRTRVWQDNSPVIDIRPWDELLMSLSKNNRKTARRTLRRAETDGVCHELAGVDDAGRAAQRLVALHREAWQGRDINPEHMSQRFEAHLEAASRRMTARGLGGISEFRRDGEVIVSQFWIFGWYFVGAYMIGVSREALRRYQFSPLYVWDGVNIAHSKNCSYLDLLRGEEPYKLLWSSRVIPHYRVILGRNLALWSPYAGYHALRSKAKRYANSESAPQWIKSAVSTYRTKRFTALTKVIGRESKP